MGVALACASLLAAAPARAGESLVAAGRPFAVGRPVVLWNDPDGFDGYARTCLEERARASSPCCQRQFARFGARRALKERSLAALRGVVKQVVLHLDGCVNSRSCFHSMHDMPRPDGGCGLSAHFMVDANGTIYQTLDLLENAWHAEQANATSIGIEICNRGDASRNELDRLPPDYRSRPVRKVAINGREHQAFDFRPEQYESVLALVRTLVKIFPGVKPVFPERDGRPLLETLRSPEEFAGIVGHLHVDKQRRKWDPGAFDWGRIKTTFHTFSFPVAVRGELDLPQEATALRRAVQAAYRVAEERGTGFFPLAPSALWHSGVHLRAAPGSSVLAPARGRVLAARLTNGGRTGTGFVLLRHELDTPAGKVTFFSLLHHLAAPTDESAVPWLAELGRAGDGPALRDLHAGKTALIDVPIEAGDPVGIVGRVDRGAERGHEVHFEIFATERPPDAIARTFRSIGAAADGLRARSAELLGALEGDDDGRLTADELRAFFREGSPPVRQAVRQLAIRHVHEWSAAAGSDLDPGVDAIARAPYVFLTPEVADHAGLPTSGTVVSYHPITFLAALASLVGGTELRLPPRAPLEPRAVPVRAASAADWRLTATPEEELPLFGPVVGADAPRVRRRDIPLIILPQDH